MVAVISIILVLFVIVFFHELGHFLAAKASGVAVLEFGIGFRPRLFAIKYRGTEYSLNLVPAGAFVKLSDGETVTPDSLDSKSPWVRLIISLAGPVANWLLAFVLLTISLVLPSQTLVGEGIGVKAVSSGSPAEAAGIEKGDVILALNQQTVQSLEDVGNIIRGKAGTEVMLLVKRGDNVREIRLLPRLDPPPGQGAMGVQLGWATFRTVERRSPFSQAVATSAALLINIPGVLSGLFSSLATDPGGTLMGPVGAARITGEVSRLGIAPLIGIAAIISAGVFLFNLFPIPPLDGGGIAIAVAEGLRGGRQLSPRLKRFIYSIGSSLLVALFLIVTYNDILKLVRGESLLP